MSEQAPWDPLATEHLGAHLGRRALRGGAAILTGQAAKLALTLATTVVLARLLTRSDYGLVGMVLAVTGFLESFRSFGLAEATVRKPDLSHQQVSFLFAVNAAVGATLGLLIAALAPALAWFYGEPRVVAITLALAVTFPIAGLSVQHRALLRRQMRFRALVGVDLAGMAAYSATSIGLALAGVGYWALVLAAIAREACGTAASLVAARWWPSGSLRPSSRRALLYFGANVQASYAINSAATWADGVLIGRAWGVEALGLYSRAGSVVFLPLRAVMDAFGIVANSTLAHLQREPERFRFYYGRAIGLQALLLTPSLAFLAVTAPDATALLLGPQWDGAGGILRVLCLAALPMPVAETHRWINLAFGRGDRVVRSSAAGGTWLLACLTAGVPFGPTGVAAGYAAGIWGVAPLALYYATRDTPIGMRDVARALLPAVAVALTVAATAALARAQLPGAWPLALRFVACAAAAGGVGLCAASALSGYANPLRWLRESLAELQGRR